MKLNTLQQQNQCFEYLLSIHGYPAIDKAIRELKEREALVIRYYFFDTLSFHEIGQLIGMSYSTVRHDHFRGVYKLAKYFKAIKSLNNTEESQGC